jgi:hypothetical protein
VTPSLQAELGSVEPSTSRVVQWLMTSTLQGEFVDYSATYRNRNALGQEGLSLIDSVTIYPLKHVVRADGPWEDGLPDFLTDEYNDLADLGDTLHLSDGTVDPVTPVTEAKYTYGPNGLSAIISVAMPAGWAAIEIDDPFENSLRLSRVTCSDGRVIRLGDNAWQTSRIDRPLGEPEVALRKLHIFDRGGTGTYTVEYEADSESPLVLAWSSVHGHGSEEIGIPLRATGLASESRSGGISTLVATFSESILPSSFGQGAGVAVTAYDANGDEADLKTDLSVALRGGDRFADITFSPPLPSGYRYCIRLVGVTDYAGNLVDAASGSIDLAVLEGDVTGDGRVTVNDAGAIGSLLGVPFDASDAHIVRCDINRDGAVTMADALLVVSAIGGDLRGVASPCASTAAATLVEGSGGDRGNGGEPSVQDVFRGIAALPGAPVGASGTAGDGGDRAGAWSPFAEDPQASVFPVDLTPADPSDRASLMRMDLLVVRAEDRALLLRVIDAFSLESIEIEPMPDHDVPTMIVRLGVESLRLEARLTLEGLLSVQGLECLSVFDHGDGALHAAMTQVQARRPAAVSPAQFVRASDELGYEAHIGADADTATWTLPHALLGELLEFCLRHADRIEFEGMRPVTAEIRLLGHNDDTDGATP